MQLSLVPFPFKGHQSTSCKAHEEPLTAEHLIKIQGIEKRTVHCFPKNDDPYIKAWKYEYPSFSYTLPQLKEYLQETLSQVLQEPAECYLVGGAAHPNEDLPFNDIDIAIYLTNPDFEKIDLAIGQFIASHVQNDAQFNSAKMPVHSTFILSKAFYKHRFIFKDRSGAIYGLREKSDLLGGVDIKILIRPNFHSCGPTDGAQVSLSRYMLRYSLGEDFAQTKAEFQKADQVARKLFYEISHPEKVEKLFLRLLFKWTHLHTFLTETLEIAKVKFKESLMADIKKFEHEFENHYLNHYPTANGKICDFLNLLFFYQKEPQMCSYFANLWLRKSKIFQLADEATVAELIITYPFLVPHLLGFIGCLSYAASLEKREESKGSETVIKYRFSDADYPSIFLTEKVGEKERAYRISLGWSLEQLITLKDALPEALKKLNVGKDYLKGLLRAFQLDPADLNSLGKEPPKALDAPENQLKGLEGEVAAVKKDVPTHIKAILEYVKGDSKEDLSSEEIYCKAFEMGLIPDVFLFPVLQKMIKTEKNDILKVAFQQLQIQIEKKGNSKAIFDIFKSIVNSKAHDLDTLTLQTVVQIYKCHTSLFEMCCQDQKLINELLEIIRRNSNEFEVLTILLENAASNINHVVLEIFNGWLNEKNVSIEQSVHFAIKLFERKVTLKSEVNSFWILKIAIRALYSSSKQLGTEESSKINDHAIRLLTLFPIESREEIRERLLVTMCQKIVKNGKKSNTILPLLAKALSHFLPAEQAEHFKSIGSFEVVVNRSEIAKYLVKFIEDNAPKLKEKEFYLNLQKLKVREEKKITDLDSEKLAKKLFGIINNSLSYEFQKVSRLYFKLIKLFLKEKSKSNSKWVVDILNRLIIYTDPNSLSMATHLYKNAYDHQLLTEEELHRCGINLIRGYSALQDLDGSFNGSDNLFSIIKRVIKYEKQTCEDLILLFEELKKTGRLSEGEFFDLAFVIFSKLMKQNYVSFSAQMDRCLFDLLSHWRNDDKYFDSLIGYIKSQVIILRIRSATFMMLLKAISSSNNPKKLDTLWSCFQYDKESYAKLAYYQLLQYFDTMNSKTERVYIRMGVELLKKYEKEMIKLVPEIEASVDYTKVILYSSTGHQDYIKRACEICLKQEFFSQVCDVHIKGEVREYLKLSEAILACFLSIPLKNYSPAFVKTALSFIDKLKQISALKEKEIPLFLAGKLTYQPATLQCAQISQIIRVFAYFSESPDQFPDLQKCFFDVANHVNSCGFQFEEDAIFDLIINLSKEDIPKEIATGRIVDASMVVKFYQRLEKRLTEKGLLNFQARLDAFLHTEHQEIRQYFLELEKIESKGNESELFKKLKFCAINVNRVQCLIELYKLCNPVLGKEIIEYINRAIMSKINYTQKSSDVVLHLIKRGLENQFYSHKKVGLFSTSEIEKEAYQKNRSDLSKIQMRLIKHSLELNDDESRLLAEKFIPDMFHSFDETSQDDRDELRLISVLTFSRNVMLYQMGQECNFSILDVLYSRVENDLKQKDFKNLDWLFDIFGNLFIYAIFCSHIAKRLRKDDQGRENSLAYLKKMGESKLEKFAKGIASEFQEFRIAQPCFVAIAIRLIRNCSLNDLLIVEESVEKSSEVMFKVLEYCTRMAKKVYETDENETYLKGTIAFAIHIKSIYPKMMPPDSFKKFYVEFNTLCNDLELFKWKDKIIKRRLAERSAAGKADEKKGHRKKRR